MPVTESRYEPIHHLWSTVTVPPITRVEAERAARRIFRRFGSQALGGPLMSRPVRFSGRVRRCWITRKTNAGLQKGWQRLVHDISHEIFGRRHPNFRPHAGGHATLEHEIADFVIARGWLGGTLRPPPRRKPSGEERRARAIERTERAIARWEVKRRRAENALKKFRRRHRAQLRRSARLSEHTRETSNKP
jgi:hypothetical protein